MPIWPPALPPVFDRFLTAEYASLTQRGAPITFPCSPYLGAQTLDVSTGLTYPAKAERARRNPRIALLYSDPTGAGLTRPPLVLVQGLATVRDADLQANTDRYVRGAFEKYPASYAGMPKFMLRQSAWYFTRIWIELTPLRIRWWPEGDLTCAPEEWRAPENIVAPPSDPAPPGGELPAWKAPPAEWRRSAATVVSKFGRPVLTFVDDDGFPLPMRVASARFDGNQFEIALPAGLTARDGPACLTFHRHPRLFTGQENCAFVGAVQGAGSQAVFRVERQLANWSAGGDNRLKGLWEFAVARTKIYHRLQTECARRNQPVPKVNL